MKNRAVYLTLLACAYPTSACVGQAYAETSYPWQIKKTEKSLYSVSGVEIFNRSKKEIDRESVSGLLTTVAFILPFIDSRYTTQNIHDAYTNGHFRMIFVDDKLTPVDGCKDEEDPKEHFCWGVTYNGEMAINTNSGYNFTGMENSLCVGVTVAAHELLHALRYRVLGDGDLNHADAALWSDEGAQNAVTGWTALGCGLNPTERWIVGMPH